MAWSLFQFFFVFAAAFTMRSLAEIDILTFDGSNATTTSDVWFLTNDPVMGGLSFSNWTSSKADGMGIWEGEVKDVPSLDAPGFCNVNSERHIYWPDVSTYSHIVIKARSTIPYKGFKLSFAADSFNQFKSFKADFSMQSTGEWEDVYIPFTDFSNDWSSYTGEPIVKCSDDSSVCPTAENLQSINQIGFWTEGVSGPFHFEVLSVSAGNMTTTSSMAT